VAPYVITSCLSFFVRISQTGRTFLICAGIFEYRNPTGSFTGNNFILHGMQISPNKSMNFRYANASFTVSPVPGRNHVVLTDPKTRPYMMFLFVAPYLCHPASFRPHLTDRPLPSASNLCYVSQRYMEHLQGTLTPLVHAHVGRTHSTPGDQRAVRFSGTWSYYTNSG